MHSGLQGRFCQSKASAAPPWVRESRASSSGLSGPFIRIGVRGMVIVAISHGGCLDVNATGVMMTARGVRRTTHQWGVAGPSVPRRTHTWN